MAEFVGSLVGLLGLVAFVVLFAVICGIFARLGRTNALLRQIADRITEPLPRPAALQVSNTEEHAAEEPERRAASGDRRVAILAVVAVLALIVFVALAGPR